ncbi:MAG: hypothetical protein QOC80_3034 [Frankiaceae bacterium]|nr:hypothetical protein [Frankiaceae bacterium]
MNPSVPTNQGVLPLQSLAAERSVKRRRTAFAAVAGAAVVIASLVVAGSSASAQTTGIAVAGGLTRPAGGVWLQPNSGAGHFFVADNALGLCEVVPAGAGFQTSACQGNAKGGQAAYDQATQKVYVANSQSNTSQVARYRYDPVADKVTFEVMLQFTDPAVSGARAAAVSLMASPSGVQKLYVGFVKSGAVMSLDSPATSAGTPAAGAANNVGSAADPKGGIDALAGVTYTDTAGVRHDNLYVGEAGGNGMSQIVDVDGTGGRPACGGATSCGASVVVDSRAAIVSHLAGGLATRGGVLYVGDAPLNGPGSVLVYNPSSGGTNVLSTNVPAYTATFDGVTRSTYSNIGGLGLGPNGDIYVGDDPSRPLATPPNGQGHLWRVPGTAFQPSITSISPATGDQAGGDTISITGANLSSPSAPSAVAFGTLPATNVTCTPDGTSCTATTPKAAGSGPVDVRVTNGDGQISPLTSADQFSYDAATVVAGAPVISNLAPARGIAAGGTAVTITGSSLANADGSSPAVVFGTAGATSVSCASSTSCTAVSPAGADGQVVTIQVANNVGTTAAGSFAYTTPVGALYASGITAPKGGVTWIPDDVGGHYWVSDHANGFCRIDRLPAGDRAPDAVNFSVCDPGFTIGSPGQAVYDPRPDATGSRTHNVYVPDNATKSPGVWRLTFNPATATVSHPVAMAPGGPMVNQKPNGMALDPVNDALYVGDLVDGTIHRVNGISGDPRQQTVDSVGVTQNQNGNGTLSRGINGTMSLLDGKLYLPENNAATYIDTTQPCAAVGTSTPCVSTPIKFLDGSGTKAFVAGVATDPVKHLLYISVSPGGANATVYRWDPTTVTPANPGGGAGISYVSGGKAPTNLGTPAAVECATSCTRPTDPTWTPGGPTNFAFAQGLFIDPNNSTLYITEDASAGTRSGRGNVWSVLFTP